jgi:hypothetical protein
MANKPEKGSKEWFEMKRQARADLDLRLSLNLPHSSKPLSSSVPMIDTGSPTPAKTKRAPRQPKAKKNAPTE